MSTPQYPNDPQQPGYRQQGPQGSLSWQPGQQPPPGGWQQSSQGHGQQPPQGYGPPPQGWAPPLEPPKRMPITRASRNIPKAPTNSLRAAMTASAFHSGST